MAPRVWLITGASSGFGRSMTEVVLAQGDIAVATLRTPAALDDLVKETAGDRLLVVKCDVTIKKDISDAFAQTIKRFSRCDIVFNNAGISHVGEWEIEEQDDEARSVFEVNFWGAANVSREAVRVFRDVNEPGMGGTLLVNSSLVGLVDAPGASIYSASKHAIKGLTESLAKELDPKWRIKVSMIEPSMFKTRIFDEGGMTVYPPHPAYTSSSLASQRLRQAIASKTIQFGDPKKGAEKIFELSRLEKLPLHFPLGKSVIPSVLTAYRDVEDVIKPFESWSEGLEVEQQSESSTVSD